MDRVSEVLDTGVEQDPRKVRAAGALRGRIEVDKVTQMPMGYDTRLMQGGASLSGGQRQRLVLARALARKPAILLLDELFARNGLYTKLVKTQIAASMQIAGPDSIALAVQIRYKLETPDDDSPRCL